MIASNNRYATMNIITESAGEEIVIFDQKQGNPVAVLPSEHSRQIEFIVEELNSLNRLIDTYKPSNLIKAEKPRVTHFNQRKDVK